MTIAVDLVAKQQLKEAKITICASSKKIIQKFQEHVHVSMIFSYMRGSRKFSRGGGGVVQIPRRGLTEYFNMAKSPDPLSPSGTAHELPLVFANFGCTSFLNDHLIGKSCSFRLLYLINIH